MTLDQLEWLDAALLAVSALVAVVLLRPKVRDATFWRATVTPLASIIGSGFLVAVPLLADIAGRYALIAMALIVGLSLWIGVALRYNIRSQDRPILQTRPGLLALERFSDLALAVAYVISITFYIRLLSGFVLTGLGAYSLFWADMVATAVLLFIGGYGWRFGLGGLERLEEYSVTIKLAIIAALLVGLGIYGLDHWQSGVERFGPVQFNADSLRQLAGLLLVVQGFETSKYLGEGYPAKLRSRTMAAAQWIAGGIYIAFVALALPLMPALAGKPASETAIIEMAAVVTLILPLMLVVAAAMSQFSAAIADTIGAGGVIESETRARLSSRRGYLIVTLLAVGLTWSSNIFEVIALASRAFALYYLFQTLQSLWLSLSDRTLRWRRLYTVAYAVLAGLLLAIVVFAAPVEG